MTHFASLFHHIGHLQSVLLCCFYAHRYLFGRQEIDKDIKKRMCKQDALSSSQSPFQLLLTVDAYRKHAPHPSNCLWTGLFIIACLCLSEYLVNVVLETCSHMHPILLPTTNRNILARHLGVDTLSCFICAILGWAQRGQHFYPILKGTVPRAGWESRLFTYNEYAMQLGLFFFCYQVKNLYDTIVWNDGPEFIFHHVFSMITVFGSMWPSTGPMYGFFYFGISEISTAVLCVLANFDDIHGVAGLGDAFPNVKIAIAAVFVVLFILCRCIWWPLTSYYFCRDISYALKSDDPRARLRKNWMRFFFVSLTGLSILQVAWLGQIFLLGKEELEKAGFL